MADPWKSNETSSLRHNGIVSILLLTQEVTSRVCRKNTRRAPLCSVDRLAGELIWASEVFSLSCGAAMGWGRPVGSAAGRHMFVRRPKPRPAKLREKKTLVITKNLSEEKCVFLSVIKNIRKDLFCFII